MMYRLDYINKNIRTPVYLGINFDKIAIYNFLDTIKLTKNSTVALVNFSDSVYIYDADLVTVVDLKTNLRNNLLALER